MKDASFPYGLLMAGAGFGLYLFVASPWPETDVYPLDDYLAAELLLPSPLMLSPARNAGPDPNRLVEEVLLAPDLAVNDLTLFRAPLP